MRERHRQRGDNDNAPGEGPDGGAQTDELQAARNAGERFLAAGDEAIQKALSRADSEQFLAAVRQRGGQ